MISKLTKMNEGKEKATKKRTLKRKLVVSNYSKLDVEEDVQDICKKEIEMKEDLCKHYCCSFK